MQIAAFSPIGNSILVAATTSNTATVIEATAPTPLVPRVLRVVNEGTTPALIAMGSSTVNATTDTQVEVVMPGERILAWKPGSTYVGVAMRSGSANVQCQLGWGV